MRFSGGDSNEIGVVNPTYKSADTPARYFTFDHAFWSVDKTNTTLYAGQEEVFAKIGVPILNNCLMGYNCSLFAYGK